MTWFFDCCPSHKNVFWPSKNFDGTANRGSRMAVTTMHFPVGAGEAISSNTLLASSGEWDRIIFEPLTHLVQREEKHTARSSKQANKQTNKQVIVKKKKIVMIVFYCTTHEYCNTWGFIDADFTQESASNSSVVMNPVPHFGWLTMSTTWPWLTAFATLLIAMRSLTRSHIFFWLCYLILYYSS